MGKTQKTLFFLLLFLSSVKVQCQFHFLKGTKIVTSAGFMASTKNRTPFLLKANQYGTVPLESPHLYLNAQVKKEYDSLFTINRKLKKLGLGYAFEPHVNLSRNSQFLLVQGYIKARYGAFEVYGGKRREIQGLVDTVGSMGSYIWSGNALPMPKLEVSIANYTSILGKGLISIKGNFAHGWFGKGDSVQQVLLHQKSLYGKLGRPNWKIQMLAGFNHQVQWGGYPTKPFYDKISKQTISTFGSDFPTFFKVASGLSLPSTGVKWDSIPGVSANEAGNRIGNHLGTVDIGFILNLKNSSILFYRQSIYEDGSLLYLSNISDGLLGITYKRKSGIINQLCIEYLNTQSQGGPGSSSNTISELRGLDNYFNNSIYSDAWTYKGNVIGNPLLLTTRELSQFNSSSNPNSIVNNRTQALHLKMFYRYKNLLASTQIISSRNLGTYSSPIDKTQLSMLQKVSYYRNKIYWYGQLSIDNGQLLPNHIGLNVGARKDFFF